MRPASPLFPTVGLHSRNETIAANFGGKPFRFDLEGMLAEEAAAEQAAIRRCVCVCGGWGGCGTREHAEARALCWTCSRAQLRP